MADDFGLGFEDWYRRAYPRLVVTLTSYTGSQEVASEAAGEAMLRAYERWKRVSRMGSPEGWVYRTALNHARRAFRRRADESRLAAARIAQADPPWEAAIDLWELLRCLPNRQREAIVLHYLGDLTEADVAVAMGVRRGTVSRTLRDALENLRTAAQSSETEGR